MMNTNTVQRARRNTIGDALTRVSERFTNKMAVVFNNRHWSFSALNVASHKVANHLLALGLQKGDRVAAYGKNSDAYLILWLACCKAGLIHVPLNFALVDRELAFLLKQSGAKALFLDNALHSHFAALNESLHIEHVGSLQDQHSPFAQDILTWALNPGNQEAPEVELDAEDVVQILYTSGTTSDPKGAMHTHNSFFSQYQSCFLHLAINQDDVALAALPLYHSAQMHVFTMPTLLTGGTSWILDNAGAENMLNVIQSNAINAVFAPPTVWINLLRHPSFNPNQLKQLNKLYYGASIMPEAIAQELSELLPQAGLYNCYGQSEMAPLATVLAPNQHQGRLASAGKPTQSVRTRIVNPETGTPCQAYEQGEIVHQSAQLMLGYWNNPKATEDCFRNGWFHSGDLGYMDEQGYLYVVDRIKDVINTGAVLVASRDVEEVLYTHKAIEEVAVIGLPDPHWGEAVTAVIVVKRGHIVNEKELLAFSKEYLAAFKIPKRFIFETALPKNSAGKLLKRELRQRYTEQANLRNLSAQA